LLNKLNTESVVSVITDTVCQLASLELCFTAGFKLKF